MQIRNSTVTILFVAFVSAMLIRDHFQKPEKNEFQSVVKAGRSSFLIKPTKTPKVEKKEIKNLISENSPERNEVADRAYCDMRKAGVDLPVATQISLIQHNDGITLYLRSDECPDRLYSKVRMDDRGVAQEVVDCRKTNSTELALKSASQGQINDVKLAPDRMNLAISGGGYFQFSCDAGERLLSRNGNLQIRQDGTVRDDMNCILLDKTGNPVYVDSDQNPDERGCFANNQCVSIVQPDQEKVSYAGAKSFWTKETFWPQMQDTQDTKVLSDALEEIDSVEEGPFGGPNWSALPYFTEPDCS